MSCVGASALIVVALLPGVPATTIPIEAGEVQRVAVRFPAEVLRESSEVVELHAEVEIDDEAREQVTIDVLPHTVLLVPGTIPIVELKIASDGCSPVRVFGGRLVLRSGRGATDMKLRFVVHGSRLACWGPVAVGTGLAFVLLYTSYSWLVNLRLLSTRSLAERIDSYPHTGAPYREALRDAIRGALNPRDRLHTWWRAGAWWRSLLGAPYRETLELIPHIRRPQVRLVVPDGGLEPHAVYLEAALGDMRIELLGARPSGFSVVPRRNAVLLEGPGDPPRGWKLRGRLAPRSVPRGRTA